MHARQLLTLQGGRRIQKTVHGCRGQLGLRLKERCGWGGRRPGAGRKPGPQPRAPHRRREGVTSRFPAHVTVKLLPGLPSLRSVPLVRALERSFAAACDRGDFRLVQYTLQTTHAHLLVEATDVRALARGMMAVGARRHARRFWCGLHLDPASSGRWFDGWRRQPLLDRPRAGAIPVTQPRTWFMAIGWRRHGLIDREEIPGASRTRGRS
jgi:hypothetical protein